MCKRFVLMRTAGDVGPYKHAVVYACKSQFPILFSFPSSKEKTLTSSVKVFIHNQFLEIVPSVQVTV